MATPKARGCQFDNIYSNFKYDNNLMRELKKANDVVDVLRWFLHTASVFQSDQV